MRSIALLAPLALVLIAADTDEAKKDLEKLQGRWQAARYIVDGKELDAKEVKGIQLTVKDDVSTYVHGDIEAKGKYKLNPAKNPKELDILVTTGADKGKTYLAIYEWDGADLRICLTRTGKERPTKFASTPGSKNDLEVWRKK